MINAQILAAGKFHFADLVVSVSESTRLIDTAIERQIEQLWQAKLKKAEENNQHIYNGLSYRLNTLRQEGNVLKLDFGVNDFKTVACLIEVPGYFELHPDYYRKSCHTLATVKTSDDKYIMVELSGKSMNVNSVDFLGGVMETNIPMTSGEAIFESLYAELAEEAAVQRADIKDSYLSLVYLNPKTSIGFYFEVTLNISAAALLERFTSEVSDADIHSLKAFSRSEYIDVLQKHNVNKQFIAEHVQI